MEEEIIRPTSKELLKSELTPKRMLRSANKSHNEIYTVTAKTAPGVMKEIGYLREIAFRSVGGGTGKSMDIDEFDTMENRCRQLIAWNPEAEEVIGGYCYILGSEWEIDKNGQPKVTTNHMFHFSDKFMKEYASYTVELGRFLVSLDYQNVRKNFKDIFALDNLWDGLGALTVLHLERKYFFRKMTVYPSYIRRGKDMILYFLKEHLDGRDDPITPIKSLEIDTPTTKLDAPFQGNGSKENHRILNREVHELGHNIPPLVNTHMDLFPTMKPLGTAINYGLGDVEGTGILIAVDEIFEEKRVRHIESFVDERLGAPKFTNGANNVIYREKEQQ